MKWWEMFMVFGSKGKPIPDGDAEAYLDQRPTGWGASVMGRAMVSCGVLAGLYNFLWRCRRWPKKPTPSAGNPKRGRKRITQDKRDHGPTRSINLGEYPEEW